MSGYTPTTTNIRSCYVFADEQYDGTVATPIPVANAEFDRWLESIRTEAFNAGLSRAAEIAAEYSEEAREYRDNETDYPESWVGMQQHGMHHGAQDVAIRIRAAIETKDEQA